MAFDPESYKATALQELAVQADSIAKAKISEDLSALRSEVEQDYQSIDRKKEDIRQMEAFLTPPQPEPPAEVTEG